MGSGGSAQPPARTASELLRKWFNSEAALADATGYVKNHESGELIPPANGVCQKVLSTREGFRRCNVSVRTLILRLHEAKTPNRLSQPCHLGLDVIGIKPDDDRDAVFCCGVATRPLDPHSRRAIHEKLAALGIEPHHVSGWEHINVLSEREQEQLYDLLIAAREEIVAKEQSAKMQSAQTPTNKTPATKADHQPTMNPGPRSVGNDAKPLEQTLVPLKEQVQALEREVIMRGLVKTHWNCAKLARMLGISRTTLLDKIAQYGLDRPRKDEQR